MNYFLFGGATNVGKTEAVVRIAHYLLGKGFCDILKPSSIPQLNQQQTDFKAVMDGVDRNGKNVRFIINSAADIEQNIDALSVFCQTNAPYHAVISAIRCEGHCSNMRQYFWAKLGIGQSDTVVEIPMASISANHNNWVDIRQWYKDGVDEITHLLLRNSPFHV